MAIRHKEYNLFGLQFHPESIYTPEGLKMIRNFLNISNIEISSDARSLFRIKNLPTLPIILTENQSVSLDIEFTNSNQNEIYNWTYRDEQHAKAKWNNPEEGWDGTSHGKAVKDGVYFIVVNAVGSDGIKYNHKGDINILRGFGSGTTGTTGE